MSTTGHDTRAKGAGPPDRHPEWERLNDLADGRLSGHDAREVGLHLSSCSECRVQLDALRSLAEGAAMLPRAIDPPDGLWDEISASIAAPHSRRRSRPTALWLAAAALALMVLSSGLTALYMQRAGNPAGTLATGGARVPQPAVVGILPASFIETERTYLTSVAEVEMIFAAQRAALTPETVAIVDRALGAIDTAILEARTALLADPANRALADLLETSYRQKLDLLRRTAALHQSS
ncbi:MAG: zf-HC2 domain-containing protein [Gemmatimonadota bacterium]